MLDVNMKGKVYVREEILLSSAERLPFYMRMSALWNVCFRMPATPSGSC